MVRFYGLFEITSIVRYVDRYDWERNGTVNEGPEILQRGGRTFLVYSGSGCSTPDYELGQLTPTGSDPLSAMSWTKKSTPVYADVANCGTSDGADVRQWAWLNNACQQWRLNPA